MRRQFNFFTILQFDFDWFNSGLLCVWFLLCQFQLDDFMFESINFDFLLLNNFMLVFILWLPVRYALWLVLVYCVDVFETEIEGWCFSMISRFLEGILTEYKDMKCSLDSKLQIGYICSIRIRSRNWDIVEKPLQPIEPLCTLFSGKPAVNFTRKL